LKQKDAYLLREKIVAAELIKWKLELDQELAPNNYYVDVFLLPTCELVSQQTEAVNK